MVNQTKVAGIFYDKCEVKQMILEACSTGKVFIGSAGRKERSCPKWHQEKRPKIQMYEYIVYPKDRDLFAELNCVLIVPSGLTLNQQLQGKIVKVFTGSDRIMMK